MRGRDAPKRIVLEPDYAGAAVFALDPPYGEVLDLLPISAMTRETIRDWAKRWDELAMHDLDAAAVEAGMRAGSTQPVPDEMWEENTRERRALWVGLQEELGSDWQVGWSRYHEGDALYVRWTPDGPVERLS